MNGTYRQAALLICALGVAVPCPAGSPFVSNYEGTTSIVDANGGISDTSTDDLAKNPIFAFRDKDQGIGDAAANLLGDGVEYKINAVNYNIYFGDKLVLPFQLFYGDFASDKSPEDSNKQKLVDPTQGLALQFPLVRPFRSGKFCSFSSKPGSCAFGGDITLRGVRLNETDAAGEIHEKSVFGGSASFKVSMLFPIFRQDEEETQAGKFGISIGVRYFYHNTKHQDLLFGEGQDPDGNPLDFKKGFGAATAEAELGIFDHFKIRLEYFSPFKNRDVLDDVFKASIVITPKS